MPKIWLIVMVIGCLVAVGGAVFAGQGIYREICVPNSGLVPLVRGIVMMGFAGIAILVAWHCLFNIYER